MTFQLIIRYNIYCGRKQHTVVAVICFIKQPEELTSRREGKKVSEIRVKDNESLDSALRRFKRQCAKSGVMSEIRKREHYEKPSVKRKKKSEAARKRKFK